MAPLPPKVLAYLPESTTKGLSNWYTISAPSRARGQKRPSAFATVLPTESTSECFLRGLDEQDVDVALVHSSDNVYYLTGVAPEELRSHLPDEMHAQPPERWGELPEQLREHLRHPLEVDPGEFVELEDTGNGLRMPKVSYEYLDGLWVLENMRGALPEILEAELDRAVLYIYAAKEGKVPIIEDSRERYEAGIAPDIRLASIDTLTPEDLENLRLEEMEFYIEDPEGMGPYVIEDSERARRALNERLGG